MSAEVIIQSTTLPEGFCPSGASAEQQRLDTYVAHMIGALPGQFTTWNSGSNTPEVDDRDKPWHRTNVDGSPDRDYDFFNGAWSSLHPVPPGVITMWMGDPTTIDTFDGGEAGVVSAQTGPMWEIVTSMAAKVPIGVGALPSGTALATGATGGEEKHTLLISEMPKHKFQCFIPGSESTSRVLDSVSGAYERGEFGTNNAYNLTRADDAGATKPSVGPTNELGSDTPFNVLPPYIAVSYIRRTARTMYVV